MATYYVDPAATGTDAGTSWTDAWTTMQRAVDGTGGTQPVAGDTIYLRGTETLSASVDMDGNDGDLTSGWIKWIGVNASGVEDGTRYVLDGNNAATHCLDFSNYHTDYHQFHNLELKNATSTGFDIASYGGVDGLLCTNLYVHDNGGHGFHSGNSSVKHVSFYHCDFVDNSLDGARSEGLFAFCRFVGNGNHGFAANYSAYDEGRLLNCVLHGNTYAGVGQQGRTSVSTSRYQTNLLAGCVIDGNADDGAEMFGALAVDVIGCRITANGGTGLLSTTASNTFDQFRMAYNYMPDTGQDRVNTGGKYTGTPTFVKVAGADTNNLSGTDTDGGYNAPASDDFNLVSGATLRAVEVDLDGTNKTYISAGLEPAEPSGGGGTDAVLVPQGLHSIEAGITA